MVPEKSLLGCFIKADYLLKDTIIKPFHLVDKRHQELLKTMFMLKEDGKNVDLITLSTVKNLTEIGGISYLNELASYADLEKFDEIEELVLDAWKEREKKNILVKAAENDWPVDKIIRKLDAINQVKIDDYQPLNEILKDLYELPWKEKPFQKGITTGIKKLNDLTNGWQDGEVTIIAARPSMGKSDVMLHFAKQIGWSGNLPIIFSLEMPAVQLTTRLIASTGNLNRNKLRDPRKYLSDEQKRQWANIIGILGKANIQIFDGPGQSVAEIRAKTRKVINQYPDKKPVILIDYLTLIKPSHFYGGNAHQQVTEISKDLKAMAKEFNCPVICLAQLNRQVEQRAEKRPMMSDIRESGSIEQDADVIIFLYREKYYKQDSENDTLELIIAKNRNGPIGTVTVRYNEYTGAIEDEG